MRLSALVRASCLAILALAAATPSASARKIPQCLPPLTQFVPHDGPFFNLTCEAPNNGGCVCTRGCSIALVKCVPAQAIKQAQ